MVAMRRLSRSASASATTAAGLQRGLERAVATQHVRRALGPDAPRAGQLVEGIPEQRDEVGHLCRIGTAVAGAHLGRADPVNDAAASRKQNGRSRRRSCG